MSMENQDIAKAKVLSNELTVDIENMLSTWMDSNSTDKWADGLRFVQCIKNRAYHEG